MGNEFNTDLNDVFISYSRRNLDFAHRLHNNLIDANFKVWFDQVSIPLGVDFQNQIDDGIEKAHNFVFIISPHSVNSPYCLKEVERAVLRKKRIIPLLFEELSPDDFKVMHPMIGKINWIYCREGQDSYHKAFEGLSTLLHKHEEYIKYGTELLLKAAKWEQNQKKSTYLLLGKDRLKAEKWMLKEFVNEQAPCVPTDLHFDFIAQSKKYVYDFHSDAFLSFAENDSELSKKVGSALLSKGLTTWTRTADTPAGENQDEAAKEGIEDADNFIYFISESSVADEHCLEDLRYAISLNKRIIPLLIERFDKSKLPAEIRRVQLIDFTDNIEPEDALPTGIKSDFEKDIDNILLKLEDDKEYYRQHKLWLSAALKWEREGKNPGVLLSGYQLQEGLNWLKLGKKNREEKPLQIHEEFLKASEQESPNAVPQVFIAYDSSDYDFAVILNRELQSNGRITWFDHKFISSDANYHEEINKGIENSENFLYIASISSCNSKTLIEQAEYAAKLNKRIITLQYHDNLTEGEFPKVIQNTPSINFTHKKGDFKAKFSEVIRTLDVDREYIKNHNKWAKLALAWQEKNQSSDLLLRGTEFNLANAWVLDALENNKKPKPSAWQLELIDESRNAIFAAKLKEERNQRRMKRALVASISLLVLALAFGVVAVLQTIEAKKNAIEAKKNADKALTQTKLAEAEKEKAEAAQVYAETNALLARKAEKNAEAEKEKAEKARKQAEESALIARNAEIQAKLSEEIAKSERKKAEKNLATAIAARKKAKEEEEKATIAKVQADRERQKAKAKELAFKSIQSFNNEDETATKATLALYAYENYQDSTKTFHQDPDIYSALRLALEKIDKNIASGINANQGGIKSLVLVDTQVLTAGSTGSIKMWDLTEDNTLIKPSEEAFSFAKNGTHLTKHIATNIDNTLMASSHADGKIRVWKAQNIESELPFNKKGFIELKGHEYPVKLTAFAKDGKSLLSLDTEGNVFFWELKEDIGLTQKPQKLDFEKGEGFKTISILPTNEDNKFLLGVNEDGDGILAEITITDAKIESYTIKNGSFNPIQSMVLNPNGDKLAIGSRFGDIDILDFRTFNKIESLNSHKNGVVSIAFSPDGKHMVSAGFDKTVQLFNMESLKANPVLIRNNSWVRTVTFNPNSEQFFTSGEDERIHVYDVRSKVMATKLKAKLEKALESEETKENVKAQLEETFGKDSGVYQYFKNDFLKLEQMTKF